MYRELCVNTEELKKDEEFYSYQELRRAVLLFSCDYEANVYPSRVGDQKGNHQNLTSDEVLNLYDTGYRWALEVIKKDLSGVVGRYSDKVFTDVDRNHLINEIKWLIEEKIQMTFYDGMAHFASTDQSLIENRKELFENLRNSRK